MNIKFLEQIFDDKETHYYIVEKFESPFLVRVPTAIYESRMYFQTDLYFKDQTWEKIKSMLRTPIDCNISVSKEYSPFQTGITVGCIEKFHKVECSLGELLKQLEKEENQKLDFYGFYTLIQSIKDIETPTEES